MIGTATKGFDEVFAIFCNRLEGTSDLVTSEPFVSDKPAGVGAPLRTLAVLSGGQPFAVIGVTAPKVAVPSSSFLNYVARRARARHAPYLVLCNQRNTVLLETPLRHGDLPLPPAAELSCPMALATSATISCRRLSSRENFDGSSFLQLCSSTKAIYGEKKSWL